MVPTSLRSSDSTVTPSIGIEDAAPPVPSCSSIALFVDVDGTLLEFAARPQWVVVDASLRALLQRLHARLGGALAFLSGRTLEDLDALFDLSGMAASGQHGLQQRWHDGQQRNAERSAAIDAVRQMLSMRILPRGVLVEDKGRTLALHFREAPEHADEVSALAAELLQGFPELWALHGNLVIELRPAGANKGDALRSFMSAPPFAGRVPVVLGDDLTDEDAFRAACDLGGYAIVVGPRRPSHARFAFTGPARAIAWLEELAATPA